MTDKKSNDSRRKLLKSIVAGSGAVAAGTALPKKWSKPLVDSVVLPTHAQTTGCPSCTGPVKSEPVVDETFNIESSDTTDPINGTVKITAGEEGESWETPVVDGAFDLNETWECGGFLKISGTINSKITSGTWEYNSGTIGEDGDLGWGNGTFSGKREAEIVWSGTSSGTDYWCKAV